MNPHRSKLIPLMLSALFLFARPAPTVAMPAMPSPVATTQPDGTPLEVQMIGDEWYHFYETPDGFAIVQDADGWWSFAQLDPDGRYAATAHRVGKIDADLAEFQSRTGPHLREDSRYWTERRDQFTQRTMPGILEQASRLNPGTASVLSVPVVLIQYPDFFALHTPASFNDMMNLPNYNGTGSFRDYYLEVSYGNLTVNATVVGWYTAPNPRAYYKYGAGTLANYNAAQQLVRSAVDRAEALGGVNWAPFDNDNDGNVDVVFIVHQGPGAECGNTGYVWSHAWYLNVPGSPNLSVVYDGKLIDRYIVQPEISCGGGHIEIGVFCHEFGHTLGLPDLYDVDYSSAGIGNWDLMAGGAWGGNGTTPQKPTHMSAWCKAEQGWIVPTVVNANAVGTTIAQTETNPVAYKVWTNGVAGNEYFLVENREKTGFDVNLPTSGLAIWHIDKSRRRTDNTDNATESHKLVDLEEADGLAQMDASPNNRGDAGDLYPGSTVNRTFNDGTNPNAHDYAGAPTQVCVSNVSNSAATMTADFCVVSVNPPNLLIRDCTADVGAEPDAPCAGNWVQSPDIWIDNNDDGVIDAPIKGVVNHLYVRAWNLGGTASNATIKCWYVNPSLGLNFGLGSPGTQITDAVTFQNALSLPTMNTLPPTPGGTGYRKYFNWLIPTPPPNIDHYCIGCVIENALDPQTSPVPLQENNLGQINYWALALKAGTVPVVTGGRPAAWDKVGLDLTVFREDVRVYNRGATSQQFLVRVEGLNNGFVALPDTAVYVTLAAGAADTLTFDIAKSNAQHMDAGHVEFKLYKYPQMELTGGLIHDLGIDNFEPAAVSGWTVRYYTPRGDNLPRPSPKYELSWNPPTLDVAGFPERVRQYEIFAATDSAALTHPSPLNRIAITGGDDDLATPGYQYFVYATNDSTMYFTVRATDVAGNPGVPAPAARALNVTAVDDPPTNRGSELALYPNAPNPFGHRTSISFRVQSARDVRVAVYDLSGRFIAELGRGVYAAGVHRLEWDGRSADGRKLNPGVYVVRLQASGQAESRKIMLLQ